MRLLMLATLVLTSWSGLGTPQATAPRAWSELRDTEFGFRINLPAQPQKRTLEGGEIQWTVLLDNEWTAYIVGTLVISQARLDSAGSKGVLDGAIAGGIGSRPGAIVLRDRSLTIGGHPGREVVFKTDEQGTTLLVTARVFLVQSRLFTLTAGVKATHEQAEIDRVVESFALIAR